MGELTSRERVIYALERKVEKLDRIPIHDSPWGATIDRWRGEGLPPRVSPGDHFGYDMTTFSPDTSPMFPEQILYEDEEYVVEKTRYGGIRRNHRNYSTTPEIIDWPVKTKEDWKRIKERLKPSYYRVDWVSGLQNYHRQRSKGRFILYGAAVGFDKIQSYVKTDELLKFVIKDPELVIDMYETDAKLAMDMYEIMVKGGFKFDAAFLFCDLGYRKGVFFSPRHYEEQLHPVFKRLCKFFKSRGLYVFLHSCGNVKQFIPYFIEEGFDVLQPLEVKAGMDLLELKEKYGDKLTFMGGIDVRVMATNDPTKIKEEIERKIPKAKEGGGYIYHSDHSVPYDVSFKSYSYLIELVKKYGRYR